MKELWTPKFIEGFASGSDQQGAVEQLRAKPYDQIGWHDVGAAVEESPEKATFCIQTIFNAAEDYIKTGMLAAKDLFAPQVWGHATAASLFRLRMILEKSIAALTQ